MEFLAELSGCLISVLMASCVFMTTNSVSGNLTLKAPGEPKPEVSENGKGLFSQVLSLPPGDLPE